MGLELGSRSGPGLKYGLRLEFWVKVRVRIEQRVGLELKLVLVALRGQG